MADALYAKLLGVAQRLIGTYGTPDCQVLRPASSSDDATPWKSATDTEQVVADGFSAVLSSTLVEFGGQGGAANFTLMNSGMALASGDLAAVLPNDILAIGGERYLVTKATPVKPGGTTVVWELTLGS